MNRLMARFPTAESRLARRWSTYTTRTCST